MRNTVIISLLIFLYSCTVSKELRMEREIWQYKNWKNEYKERALYLCILKGYENKEIENELVKNDKSFYNPLGIAIFDKSLKSVISKEVEKIKEDSIISNNDYPSDLIPIYRKRAVLNHCINFYNSKKLDSISNIQRKKWKKITNILDEVHKELPTY